MKCEVCGSTDEVAPFDCAGKGVLIIPVCPTCLDSGKFKEWLTFEFEVALSQDPPPDP